MPAIVGAIKVINVSGSAIFNIGDIFRAAPLSNTKTYAGGGSFNTGLTNTTYTNMNVTRVNDQDVEDSDIVSSN